MEPEVYTLSATGLAFYERDFDQGIAALADQPVDSTRPELLPFWLALHHRWADREEESRM